MASGNNKNHVSIWFWMFALFITAIPCFGVVMIFVWAFVGENESRKNYFKAIIAWGVILFLLWAGLMTLGFWPEIVKAFQTRLKKTMG